MTLHLPPSWLQNGSHPAENDRLTNQALWATTGVINMSSMAVTANSPVGMTVIVADGWAAIVGTTQPDMGVYVAYNDAPVTLTITTANATLPRKDLICATINDSFYSGALDNVVYQVIAGTPNASPVIPATPANSIALAEVLVGAAVLSINSGNITDLRVEVTTNVPSNPGDITSVTAGTGLSGGGSAGAVTLSIDTAVTADLTTAQVMTNKSLTAPKINVGINAQTGTTYTTVLSDNGALVTQTNASPIATTIALNSSVNYPVGAQINFAQLGAGQVTIQGAGGVTVVSTGATAATPKLRVQYSTATAIQTSTNNWLVVGDIA
jgi:hypothetical protein